MRVAIFSDVHGNLTALEAVLKDIKKQQPDLILFAGDLCVFGSQPEACVQVMRAEDIGSIHGNTDLWISNDPLMSVDIKAEEAERNRNIETAPGWTWSRLNEMDLAWLRALPFQKRLSPTADPEDDLFVVHANPKDVDQPIFPSTEIQKELFGEIKQKDEDLRPLLGDLFVGVLCFGHVHIPNIRQWQNLTLANISSVSLPMDGDTRAKYGFLTWQDGWQIELRRVEYDISQEVNNLKRLKPPQWQQRSRQLETGFAS